MLLKQGEALNVQLSSVQENLSSEPVLGQLITALKNKYKILNQPLIWIILVTIEEIERNPQVNKLKNLQLLY